MLGRKDYTSEELDQARAAVSRQLGSYRKLAKAVSATGDAKVAAALKAFEPILFDELALSLDRRFVHRIRAVAGKDGNPLNEVELVAESLMDHDGVLHANKVIRYVPDESVLELEPGDPIELTADQYERLATAFLAELEERFV